MANELEQARKIINDVDAQMAELFVKRMRAAEMVYEYKKEYGLPILDQKREEQLIASNAEKIDDDIIRGYYIDYLKNLMSLSRDYQYRMQNGLKVAYSGVEGAFAHIAAGRIFPGCEPMTQLLTETVTWLSFPLKTATQEKWDRLWT